MVSIDAIASIGSEAVFTGVYSDLQKFTFDGLIR
jgi:hypothetical protein